MAVGCSSIRVIGDLDKNSRQDFSGKKPVLRKVWKFRKLFYIFLFWTVGGRLAKQPFEYGVDVNSVPVRFSTACGIPRILRKWFAQVVSTRTSSKEEESGPSLARCWRGCPPPLQEASLP